jgi:hypothetical protein
MKTTKFSVRIKHEKKIEFAVSIKIFNTLESFRNIYIYLLYVFTGPKLPMRLEKHAMVQLGNRQAIIGGFGNGNFQDKIHLFSCTNRICSIYQLDQVLSLPRERFVAIPIPDTLSGCITGGKTFHRIYHINLQLKT